ncbi:hypothetical protein [Sphingomonas parapaucimobilis]|uniref:Tetratricopeptide repeat protein n=1 Tax=Sphingomonas parapaucimobilis NBRC 15100 TaxID=1219049 RepID=A0A0A1W479_9SPHN|nr:hypothetical protein [Sphingomonas parapaucimobilis]GAL99920.1 hypothetical protein SP5_016_00510 [Sphingomonas parapaucimobilis NBRC 15100]
MLIALLFAAAAPDCTYDRAAMMALPQQTFDQEPGGWRSLSMRGCEAEAADLIRNWREKNKPERLASILYWHEGQLRANLGQRDAAITLFEKSRKTVEDDHGMGWNLYVDGSIAFLRRDRPAFDKWHAALAALPKPEDFDPRGPDGKPIAIAWPMNLNVLDGFARCWDKSYKEAYGMCAMPNRIIKTGA